MNLSEERRLEKLYAALDAMSLSPQNRALAEEYLDPSQPEQASLLKQAEHQDFSAIDKERRSACISWLEHLKKRGREDEYGRFLRFAAATGGSTACYVLSSYTWNLRNTIASSLSPEQAAAIQAEGIVWEFHSLREWGLRSVLEAGKRNPDILCRAIDYCWNKDSANAKILLAALCLSCKKPLRAAGMGQEQGGFKKLFSLVQTTLSQGIFQNKSKSEINISDKENTDEKYEKIVSLLESYLAGSLENMFTGAKPSGGELGEMKEYLRSADPLPPLPGSVSAALAGKTVSAYLMKLSAGSAFLALGHSAFFSRFLRLAMAMDMRQALDAMENMAEQQRFEKYMPLLEALLPASAEPYISWCLEKQHHTALKRMAAQYPDEIKKTALQAAAPDLPCLLESIREGNAALYDTLTREFEADFMEKMAEGLTEDLGAGAREAKRFLLGECSAGDLAPFLADFRAAGQDYSPKRHRIIGGLSMKNDTLYKRALVLEGLCMRSRYFQIVKMQNGQPVYDYKEPIREERIGGLLDLYANEAIPFAWQLEAMEGILNSFYLDKDKKKFTDACVSALRKRWPSIKESVAAGAREGSAFGRILCIRLLDEWGDSYKERLLSCALDSSKQVRELLLAVYESRREWAPEIKAMLSSKKSQERELSVLVLRKWGASAYAEELKRALETEKSRKVRELIEDALGIGAGERESASAEGADSTDISVEALTARILKGGKKRRVAWAFETPYPPVRRADGTDAPEDTYAAILAAYAELALPGISPDARILADSLNAGDLAANMALLFNRWLETGAPAKQKWVLYAASIHGGDAIVPLLYSQIQEWPKHARGAMAAEAVKALALNGSTAALLQVDQISRKFKFRQVKAAAGDALSFAAQQLGLSRDELEDRIVPDLGFDERMEQVIDYGARTFRAVLSPSLEIDIFDSDGKRLKNLPAPGKRDDEETARAANAAFKQMKKQLKAVVSNQKLRLEQALMTRRQWSAPRWTELFVKNPVMHQFAISLIWGVYEDGRLKDTFRYMEDGSFNTADEEEYELPAGGRIGLVHPVELDQALLNAWKEQLEDYEVTQPIEQLTRPVSRPTKEEETQTELTRFGGMLLNGLSLSGKLQGMGWIRGPVEDAGVYSTFYREDDGLCAVLEFSGCFVGDENEEVTVYGAYFTESGQNRSGNCVWRALKKENQMALGDVEAGYFSEVCLQLARATASSKEQLAYPACRQ